ncbi:MAG: type II toxin-antitoxin system VapC family toxin [Acidobacteriota bacterium]
MIVVDTNILAYLLLPGGRSSAAAALLERDPEWAAPVLWRSELRQVLATYLQRGDLTLEAGIELWSRANTLLGGRQHLVPTSVVLRLAQDSGCSAYDCEYVALAQVLGVPLVTEDRALLDAFGDVAQPL